MKITAYPFDLSWCTTSFIVRNVDPMYEFNACVGNNPITDAVASRDILIFVI